MITVERLNENDIDRIVEWYRQNDKSWLFCDDPVFDEKIDNIRLGFEYSTNISFESMINTRDTIIVYSIKDNDNLIGFTVVRYGFQYFTNITGYSVGIDIPESSARGKGFGKKAVELLLDELKKNNINEVYIETLSYNEPMQKIAKDLGFKQCNAETPQGWDYDYYYGGFSDHIDSIAKCLEKPEDDLLNSHHSIKPLLFVKEL